MKTAHDAYHDAYIVSTVRTAVGKAPRGTLHAMRPDDMAAIVLAAAVDRVRGLALEQIDDIILGIAAQRAGFPDSIAGCTVNRFCASGLQAIAMGHQTIVTGQADVVISGGAESMSLIPMGGHYLLPNPELLADAPEAYCTMGITAENVAQQYHISRQEQDQFALRSHQRAISAIRQGRFAAEIIPMIVRETQYVNGQVQTVETFFETDEGPRSDTSLEALARLQPVFRVGGTVTAGNASQTSDGAAATVIVSDRMLRQLDVEPMAKLLGFAVAGVAPELMGIGPVMAVPKVLQQVGLTLEDIGLIELNEAFAAQALAVIHKLGLDEEKVNVNGGAIALGHPLGCTGAKLTATLLHEMKRREIRYGLCTMCIGGGMGAAGVFENLMI
jgi:acetyl-CoA acyltransferase